MAALPPQTYTFRIPSETTINTGIVGFTLSASARLKETRMSVREKKMIEVAALHRSIADLLDSLRNAEADRDSAEKKLQDAGNRIATYTAELSALTSELTSVLESFHERIYTRE